MPLPILSFQQLVDNQVAAMQASATVVLDFSIGSILLAICESNAGNGLWLESTAEYLLAVTRLTTSTGNDVDTFVQQFGLTRNPAIPASGYVTLSRYTPTLPATINVGSLVSSLANGISYAIQPDTTNPYYNPSQSAFILPAGISSTSVPVVATTAGSIGNVLANQITTIQSVITNIDTVTNPDAFTNGQDQESDAALKIRFVLYLNSLSKATLPAIEAAVASVPGVERYVVVENVDILDNPQLGFFYVVIDDGTGHASSDLQSDVYNVVYITRGLTIQFAIYGPIATDVNVTAHVFTDHSLEDSQVQAAVVASLQTYISGVGFDGTIPYSEIPRIIYDTNLSLSGTAFSPITNVTSWLLDGGTSDVTFTGQEIPVPGTITVVMNA